MPWVTSEEWRYVVLQLDALVSAYIALNERMRAVEECIADLELMSLHANQANEAHYSMTAAKLTELQAKVRRAQHAYEKAEKGLSDTLTRLENKPD